MSTTWGAYNGLTAFMAGTIFFKEVQFWRGLDYTFSQTPLKYWLLTAITTFNFGFINSVLWTLQELNSSFYPPFRLFQEISIVAPILTIVGAVFAITSYTDEQKIIDPNFKTIFEETLALAIVEIPLWLITMGELTNKSSEVTPSLPASIVTNSDGVVISCYNYVDQFGEWCDYAIQEAQQSAF